MISLLSQDDSFDPKKPAKNDAPVRTLADVIRTGNSSQQVGKTVYEQSKESSK